MNLRHGFLLLLAMLLVAPLGAVDPFDVPDLQWQEIIGTWTYRNWNTRNTVTFAKDGTFKGVCMVDGKITDRYEGEFELETPYIGAPLIKWKYLKSNTIPVGTLDADKVEMVNAKILVLWTKGGLRHAYSKYLPPKKK